MVKRYSRTIPKKKDHKILWYILILLTVITVIVLLILNHFGENHQTITENVTKQEPYYADQQAKDVLESLLRGNKFSWEKKARQGNQPEIWKIRVPEHMNLLDMHLKIKKIMQPFGVDIVQGKDRQVEGHLQLAIGQEDSVFFLIEMNSVFEPVSIKGQVAIIVDDFGDRWDGYIQGFATFGKQITISILPGRQHSRRIARDFEKCGCEVLLHLPMEPEKGTYSDNRYLILTGMKPIYIQEIIAQSIDELPGISGVNNHMGSRATADRATMEIVMKQLSQHQLYFVDSRTTPNSVAYDIARAMGVPSIQKDLFLDNELNETAIKNRLAELVQEARVHKKAVGIAHCHRITLNTLQKEIPRYRKMGVQFVSVSQLIF